ncbi:MAG: ATP-binding protein, partial [Acidiphilium sp.]
MLGFEVPDQTRIATSVSEIARNAVIYAGNGQVMFALGGNVGQQTIIIRISDQGPGIGDIETILAGHFKSPTGYGLGIIGTHRLMDSCDIVTKMGSGTTITLTKRRPKGEPELTPIMLAAVVKRLAADRVVDPAAEIRAQNQDLLRSLNELRSQEEETSRLNAELESTNKGVVALYAELDQASTDLKALNATLEQRIADATAARLLVEDNLRQSLKMEAVGQLTGGLAHDFNNILMAITGSLEMLRSNIAKGRLKDMDRYIGIAQNSADRAAALTQRLLAFSRRQTLDPRPTDANKLVAGMIELIQGTVGPAIAVETCLAPDLWVTLCDSSQLDNALLNLCINARDAMPDGGRLSIETMNIALDEKSARLVDMTPGHYVGISVSDTGIGMSPDVIAVVFDPFFTTKPLGMGTGLGLSMVYGFAKQSGGQVRISSEVGKGTTMRIHLPRHSGLIDEDVETQHPNHVIPANHGETILVVDDEPAIRMLVTETLNDLGYFTIEAADGAEGMKVLRSDARIDLLISDVGLPGGLNGRQMADAAR